MKPLTDSRRLTSSETSQNNTVPIKRLGQANQPWRSLVLFFPHMNIYFFNFSHTCQLHISPLLLFASLRLHPPRKSWSNISPDAWINYANKHENKVVFHCFKSQGFRQLHVGEGLVFWGSCSRKASDARTMRRRREGWRKEGSGRKDKNVKDFFLFCRSHQGQRRKNPDFFSVARQPTGAAGWIGPNCRRW